MFSSNEMTAEFVAALKEYLHGAGEDSLLTAYEIGRQALGRGASVLEVTSAHKSALITLLEQDRRLDAVELLNRAEPFLFECLSPFDLNQQMSREANTILRKLNHMLEDEAGHIAHKLHDEAGGILASAKMKLDLVARELPPDVLQRLEQVRELLDQTGEQLRHLSHELRPMILDDLGLRPALDYLANGLSKRTGLTTEVHGRLDQRPASAVELALYKSVQEALNNVVRHGGNVGKASVRLAQHRTHISCMIEDDGNGFDLETVMSDKGKVTMGLAGIRERVHAVGGSLNIQSTPGKGTTIAIQVPITA